MKQFLRYQISGSVFYIWVLIFYYGRWAPDIEVMYLFIHKDIDVSKPVIGFFSAMPIGVLIHQVSVTLKNQFFGKFIKGLSDFPSESEIKSLKTTDSVEFVKYVFERISNLNSFYYVRVDNGLLSPLMAYVFISIFFEGSVKSVWVLTALTVAIILLSYLPRLMKEIDEYNSMLPKADETDLDRGGPA